RALHPSARDQAPREGPDRHLRRRHREPLLHDRHRGGAPGARGRRGRDPDGEERRARRLRRRPAHRSGRDLPPGDQPPRGDRARAEGDGHDCALALHGQPPADLRVRARARKRAAGGDGRERRHSYLERGGRRRTVSKIDDFLADATQRMDKSVEATHEHFNSVRTGRASAALLDRIQIDYYGTPTPLKNIATINVPEPRLLTIQPFDPSAMKQIERAIQESDLGLTPSNDGKIIRLPIPQLTEERRKELVKVVRHMAEEGRVAVRN